MSDTWLIVIRNHLGGVQTHKGCDERTVANTTAAARMDPNVASITTTREHCGYV